ncbi:MAG: hypothetical protein JWR38_4638 [Mucilaginibacter sp.]|nr:hypothetical protein [Mucilaginibacter sp.]
MKKRSARRIVPKAKAQSKSSIEESELITLIAKIIVDHVLNSKDD